MDSKSIFLLVACINYSSRKLQRSIIKDVGNDLDNINLNAINYHEQGL